MNHSIDTGTTAGTVGGTLLAAGMNIYAGDIGRTVVLATIGAIVSFGVSLLLKYLTKRWRKRK